ncbi:TetR/AcrR family transcriptional regulator [Streptomyces sp. TLI_171]|uniref:TetR/AcrR family transcriptional regulator n=1 Tax=Streptomyces sp. TLI_171 TaxID=1938859 RepID=UPI000C39FD21|nr:TetR/AcrR family transcriptional regulator [Streptomyces sp. TLI_171]RKE22969.1 TetR family transcriptional regulator [Streptomyces sp. TLI_171]
MPASPAQPPRPMRADARRNYERLVAAAERLVGEQGAEVSLEEVARAAGVGSATLHRHFPSRQALLEAVFKERVSALCATADTLTATGDPGAALAGWLHAVGAHAVANRGLGTALMHTTEDPAFGLGCHTMILAAGDRLLDRARAARAVRPEVTTTQLLRLVTALARAAEGEPNGPAETGTLIDLALDGIRHHRPDPPAPPTG